MKQNRWKKIIGIFLLFGVLVFSFWYGGDAPGLHGFSVGSEEMDPAYEGQGETDNAMAFKDDPDEGHRTKETDQRDNRKDDKSTEAPKAKKGNIFQQIIMKVKKLGSSKKAGNNNPQLNKKAQKNANKSVEKSKKKKSVTSNKDSADKDRTDSSQNTDIVENKNNSTRNDSYNTSENSNSGDGVKNSNDNSPENDKAANDDNSLSSDKKNNGSDDRVIDNDNNSSNNIDGNNKTESQGTGASDNNSSDVDNSEGEQRTDSSFQGETEGDADDNEAKSITCTIYISCASVLNHMDELSDATKKIIPENGVILEATEIKVKDGATVFDVLNKAARSNKVHLEYNYTPAYKTYYIEGIGNLYQFDAGNLSGWMYSVNGSFPGVGCSGYKVEDGDEINWLYTCSFGKDVGGYVENK